MAPASGSRWLAARSEARLRAAQRAGAARRPDRAGERHRLRRLVGDGSGPVYEQLHDGDVVDEAVRALALVRR
jgi:hypothetical protein